MSDGITYRMADEGDLADILRIQREAFGRLSSELGIPVDEMPPLQEDVRRLEDLHSQGMKFIVAVVDGGIVGTVRGRLKGDTVEVGRLAVGTEHLHRGIGTALMTALEEAYPEASRLSLFTGAGAVAPLALYEKLGYRLTKSRTIGSVPLVWLEKSSVRQEQGSGHVS